MSFAARAYLIFRVPCCRSLEISRHCETFSRQGCQCPVCPILVSYSATLSQLLQRTDPCILLAHVLQHSGCRHVWGCKRQMPSVAWDLWRGIRTGTSWRQQTQWTACTSAAHPAVVLSRRCPAGWRCTTSCSSRHAHACACERTASKLVLFTCMPPLGEILAFTSGQLRM